MGLDSYYYNFFLVNEFAIFSWKFAINCSMRD